MDTVPKSSANAWHLHIDKAAFADVQSALEREWLVTNGLGGYASGSIVGATTRSYHGLLVAALHPPVERTVLVSKVDEEVTMPDGQVLKFGGTEITVHLHPGHTRGSASYSFPVTDGGTTVTQITSMQAAGPLAPLAGLLTRAFHRRLADDLFRAKLRLEAG